MDGEAEHTSRQRRVTPGFRLLTVESFTGDVRTIFRIEGDLRQLGRAQPGHAMIEMAKVMAIDMASTFKAAPGGFLDEKVGRRLRDEVYGVGNTRDVAVSVEKFLGRPRSQDAYLEYVGIKK